MLYVPASSEKMLAKAPRLPADTVILDLEDSVASHRKEAARAGAREAILAGGFRRPVGEAALTAPSPACAVRINAPSEDAARAEADLEALLPLADLAHIVVPKVEHESEVLRIVDMALLLRSSSSSQQPHPLSLVLSIESPAALLRAEKMLDVISRNSPPSSETPAYVSALLFASEDFCHAGNIVRTRSRRELLHPRQMMSLVAKARGLSAIDMVCVDYRDEAYLEEECQDGREIGFDGKQAVSSRWAL